MSRLTSWTLNAIYLALLGLALPFIVWQSIRTGKYRDGFREKFLGLVPIRAGSSSCVWIHAVSVGEVNLLDTLLRTWRTKHPDWQFVISTTSRSGYELAKKKYADLMVFYCPLDFSWAVRRAMRHLRPTVLVLAELELWPNLIGAAREYGAKVAIINGRLSDHSFPEYRRIRPFVASMLRKIEVIAAQSEESAERFRALGAPPRHVEVTGSLKYDGAQTDRTNSRTASLSLLVDIRDEDVVFLAGSTQEPEEQVSIDIYRRLSVKHPELRLILVPRHPERFGEVARLLDESKLTWLRRSMLGPVSTPPGSDRSESSSHRSLMAQRPILLVDTVGELGAWWGAAHIAFVGGSFGSRGGQNMIEPAAYGAAVSFGPNTRNFRDIVAALLAAKGAVVAHDAAELEAFVQRCLEDRQFALRLGRNAQGLVRSQLGATARTVELLDSLLSVRDELPDTSKTMSAA